MLIFYPLFHNSHSLNFPLRPSHLGTMSCYHDDFEEFLKLAVSLFVQQPSKVCCTTPSTLTAPQTRMTMKVRAADREVIAKVTDDSTVLKFSATTETHLKQLQRLNTVFIFLTTQKHFDDTEPKSLISKALAAAEPQPEQQSKKKKK